MLETLSPELEFYARNGAALFPIPAGSKAPHGIVASFKHDHSTDAAQWARWYAEHRCNFGVVAFASQWIIVDPDADKVGREAAWQTWCDLCSEWGIPTAAPHVQSARGGWHIYFQVPPHIDASQLRQPDAVKGIINIRCVGYTVAAGSFYDGTAKGEQSGPYLLFPNAPPPHPAPDALLAHCMRVERREGVHKAGEWDRADVAALLRWLNEHDAFATYEDWVAAGMAMRAEFLDDGEELWSLCHDATVTPDVALAKWQSFATETTSQSVTLASLMKRAHAAGWTGSIRPSTSAMFADVPALAAKPVPILFGRGEAHMRLFLPLLQAVPILPRAPEHPELPDIGHPLRDAINQAIPGILADPGAHVTAHAVLNLIHPETAAKVWPVTPLVAARTANLEAMERQALAPSDWARDPRSQRIESDNISNVEFYLNSLGISVRWNEWLERIEVRGWIWPTWSRLDDTAVVRLRMEASRTGTRFVMGKEFASDSLMDISHRNKIDPACELLDKWQAEWDGTPRIDNWLCRACGVTDDAYHRAVSRVVLLGLVGRIRHPGIKFDLMMVLVSPKQGTEKSSLAKALALDSEWFVENIQLDMEPKELVLLLAGKTVAEVTEMRNRGDAEAAKAMISTTHDEGRTAYGRFTARRARRNILIGSTNKAEFLEDASGARRFLPVNVVGTIDLGWVRANLAQLIGEAAAALASEVARHNGEKIELPPEVWDLAGQYQEAARAVADFEVYLQEWFANGAPGYIMPSDVAALLKDATGRSIAPNKYGEAMRKLGFNNPQEWSEGRNTRVWRRGMGGTRWTVARDSMSGRMMPKQMFGALAGGVVVPLRPSVPALPY